MGGFFAKMFGSFTSEKRILMLGLDAAGKTTVLYKLQLGEVLTTIPTIGFNVETLKYKNLSMTIWDVGGQTKIRPLWRHYYQNTDALIYVVDSADRERIDEAKEELAHVLSDDLMRDAHVLVFANKMDLPGAHTPAALASELGLDKLRNRQWYIQGSSAVKGDGLIEGMDWLTKTINATKKK